MKIKTWRDPYEIGVSLTEPKEIELNPGLTVLCGCNGCGKTTLLRNIKDVAHDSGKIPCVYYDNLDNSSSSMLSSILGGVQEFDGDDMSSAIMMWNASEGEAIRMNVKRQSTLYKEFLETGYFKDRSYRFASIFRKDEDAKIKDPRRIFLFDATDSGLSIDSICELKKFFQSIISVSEKLGYEVYIIIAANEYELCRGEQCFDVVKGKYITFADYEEYREFIIESRKRKEKRIDKQLAWSKKQLEKEKLIWEKKTKEFQEKWDEIKKSEDPHRNYWRESDLQYELDSIRRNFRHYDAPEYKLV